MKSFFSNALVSMLGLLALALLFTATACGTAATTPTRSPVTPTQVSVAQATPTVATTPTLTATVTPTTTTGITATATPTTTKVAQFVTPTRAGAKPTNTKSAAPPAPGPLTGHIAFAVRFPGVDFISRQVWVMNADGSSPHQILERSRWPSFSPDGTRMAYYELDTGLHLADANGGGGKAVVTGAACCYSWSPDGLWIAYTQSINQNKPTGH